MKNILAIILSVLFSISLQAEYSGHHIKFSIENISGQITIGYGFVVGLNLDSLNNTEYLKMALDQTKKGWVKRDTLTYFKERIKYDYYSVFDSTEPKHSIYYLTNKISIPFKLIKRIKIEDFFDFTYLLNISSELKLSDTVWMNKKPIKSYVFNGYLCSYQIFVHENSPKIDEIIKQLEQNQKESEITEMPVDDDELYKTVKRFNKYKVVVIGECTC